MGVLKFLVEAEVLLFNGSRILGLWMMEFRAQRLLSRLGQGLRARLEFLDRREGLVVAMKLNLNLLSSEAVDLGRLVRGLI